jgi:membrane associated rhomboid family serine protease
MEESPPRVALRTTRRRAQADEWALVLAAEGLDALVAGSPDGFVLAVPASEYERAERALASFADENVRVPPPPEPPAIDARSERHAFAVAIALLLTFAVTGPEGGVFAGRGDASAQAIRDGAVWRSITALLLHADAAHVLGNAIAGALFLGAVFRAFGCGVGGALALASGALGNMANALLRAPDHATIGASTAVFGALGIAAGHSLVQRRASLRGRPLWLPIGAALALLAFLGTTGERVDLWAHAFGLVAGMALGCAAAYVPVAWLASHAVQRVAGAATLVALAGAWWLALRS